VEEHIVHQTPKDIVADLIKLEAEIANELNKLSEIVG
jgi:hypothetical protein